MLETATQPNTENRSDANPASENGLPAPGNSPDSTVVIYDGKCMFCTKSVKRLYKWDRGGRLSFVSLHHPFVAANYPELTQEMLLEQMYVVTPSGKQLGGAAAFRFLTRKLPRLWLLAPFLHIPFSLPLWQWGYMQIANRRYRLDKQQGAVCDGDACEIHFGDDKK